MSLMEEIRAEAGKVTVGTPHEETVKYSYSAVSARAMALLAVAIVGAGLAWSFIPAASVRIFLYALVLIGTAVLGIAAGRMLTKGNVAGVPLAFAYCFIMGGVLSWISRGISEQLGSSIVFQAVLATITTAVAVVLFSRTPIGKRTGRAVRVFAYALIGYFIFGLVNFVFALLGVGDGWGLAGLGGIGLVICFVGCLLASWSLNVSAVEAMDMNGLRVPEALIWASAFAIVVSLLWMYMEFLRLFAIVRS